MILSACNLLTAGVRGGQTGDRNARRGTGNVIQADGVAEADRGRQAFRDRGILAARVETKVQHLFKVLRINAQQGLLPAQQSFAFHFHRMKRPEVCIHDSLALILPGVTRIRRAA